MDGSINAFVIPTVEEISDYCRNNNFSIIPLAFFDYYSSIGWMVGKNRMQDWRPVLRQWERRNKDNSKEPTAKVEEIKPFSPLVQRLNAVPMFAIIETPDGKRWEKVTYCQFANQAGGDILTRLDFEKYYSDFKILPEENNEMN